MRRLAVILLSFAGIMPMAATPDPLVSLRPGHPRLLLTGDELAAAVSAAESDPLRAQLHRRIIADAEAELDSAPVEHVLRGPRLLDKSRTCLGRVLTCAMAYRLTGDARFADRAKKELFAAAAFPDWNPSHFLDVAEMSLAFAIGYDWLYSQFTPGERAVLKTAMLEHGLALAPDAYAPGGATDRRVGRWVTARHNWNQVCNGGLLAAALALADEEPDLARLVVNGARKSLPLAMAEYSPDGAYPEGPGYWGYGTGYNVIALAILESALGTDFGLGAAPGFDRTALYRLHVQSPIGVSFNYADSGSTLDAQPEYTWLATRFDAPGALAHSRELLVDALKRSRPQSRFFPLHAVWFPAAGGGARPDAPLDMQFRGPAQLAIFRSTWRDPRAIFVGFKAGRNDVNHSHLDLGSFVLDADGVRWMHDFGGDDYNLPAYFGAKRWTYFRLTNFSHNTITPGDVLQDPKADAPIIAFGSTPARTFAVADITAAYPGVAVRMHRGIALLDRARVLVQDDVEGLKPGIVLRSRMVTSASVDIVDARRAILTQDGRTLRVEIIAPQAAHFVTESARPPTGAERQNEGFTILTAVLAPEGAEARLAVLLSPVADHWPAPLRAPRLTPLARW